MAERIGFQFPVDLSDQFDGFNDAGMEHFTGAPYAALGREVTQNVIDATRQAPAKIVARLRTVPTNSIPNVDELRATLNRGKTASEDESEKAKIFFERAVKLINQSKITVLQIEDFNTTGVSGPCENGTPYYALMKASGQSKKIGENSIGTFGIGKYAPFVVSELRTVFISTVWDDGRKWQHYVQGKSILMPHKDDNDQTCRGVGYWGVRNKCLPVVGFNTTIPEWLLRAGDTQGLPEAQGTTVSVLGFDASKGWQHRLAATMAENFFGAIIGGKLEVNIDDVLILTKQTIKDILEDPEVRAGTTDMKGEPEKFDNAKLYLEAISGGSDVIVANCQNAHLGYCQLRLLVREGLPKRVAFLRDGMMITQDLERLRRFGEFKEFVGVLECLNSKGNRLLKNMEPPRHDDFEPDRLPTNRERTAGRVALRELAIWARDMLRRYAQDPVSEVSSVDELKEFFWDEADEGSDGREAEENPLGRVNIRARPLRKKDRAVAYERVGEGGDEFGEDDGNAEEPEADGEHGGGGSGGGGDDGTGGPDEGDGDGTRSGSGGGGARNTPARIRLQDVRSVPLSRKTRMIAFTADFSGEIRLVVQDFRRGFLITRFRLCHPHREQRRKAELTGSPLQPANGVRWRSNLPRNSTAR